MIRGLGIDAIEIERVGRVHERHGRAFLEKVFSPREILLYSASPTPRSFLAGRFAAKEAVMKVLGTGWARGVSFKHVEILRDVLGAPRVELTGGAAERARALGMGEIHVTITHTRDLAVACALADAD